MKFHFSPTGRASIMKVYVARQPIFDQHQQVIAYELLFRSNMANAYQAVDGDLATTSVITNSLLDIGLQALTGGRPAYINFTQNLLLQEIATVLPKEQIVIEILETVIPDMDIISACARLKEAGYTLALDDFVLKPEFEPLIELADIIKVDFMQTLGAERESIVRQIGGRVKFLAEKVETWEEFQQARDCGYCHFQGYFFSKPIIVTADSIPTGKMAQLRLLKEIHQPGMDLSRIEDIMKRDVALSYKMFKYINCAAFGIRKKIETIKHALVMLGEREVKKWITLCALTGMAEDKPSELLVASIVRARFSELLAHQAGLRERTNDAFLMGIFSMIDALVNRPKQEIFEQLPIATDVKDAIVSEGAGDSHMDQIFALTKSYEQGDWDRLERRTGRLPFDAEAIPDLYLQSIEWANEFL